MRPTRLLEVQQYLVRSTKVVEVEPQQEHVLGLARQLGPSQAVLQHLLILADLLKPQVECPRAHRLDTFRQPSGDGLRLPSDRDPLLRPALEDPGVREIGETMNLPNPVARPPRRRESHRRRYRRG